MSNCIGPLIKCPYERTCFAYIPSKYTIAHGYQAHQGQTLNPIREHFALVTIKFSPSNAPILGIPADTNTDGDYTHMQNQLIQELEQSARENTYEEPISTDNQLGNSTVFNSTGSQSYGLQPTVIKENSRLLGISDSRVERPKRTLPINSKNQKTARGESPIIQPPHLGFERTWTLPSINTFSAQPTQLESTSEGLLENVFKTPHQITQTGNRPINIRVQKPEP